jgi:hypothetical protein
MQIYTGLDLSRKRLDRQALRADGTSAREPFRLVPTGSRDSCTDWAMPTCSRSSRR